MSKITSNDVRKVAKLARLEIPDDQVEIYTSQLEKILAYVAQLEEVETEGVLPSTRAVEAVNVVRNDTVITSNIKEDLLDQAPHREGNFFRVPKILSD